VPIKGLTRINSVTRVDDQRRACSEIDSCFVTPVGDRLISGQWSVSGIRWTAAAWRELEIERVPADRLTPNCAQAWWTDWLMSGAVRTVKQLILRVLFNQWRCSNNSFVFVRPSLCLSVPLCPSRLAHYGPLCRNPANLQNIWQWHSVAVGSVKQCLLQNTK